MTKYESFLEKQLALEKALQSTFMKLALEAPESFYAWLGMTYNVSPEDPCDEEFMKDITGV